METEKSDKKMDLLSDWYYHCYLGKKCVCKLFSKLTPEIQESAKNILYVMFISEHIIKPKINVLNLLKEKGIYELNSELGNLIKYKMLSLDIVKSIKLFTVLKWFKRTFEGIKSKIVKEFKIQNKSDSDFNLFVSKLVAFILRFSLWNCNYKNINLNKSLIKFVYNSVSTSGPYWTEFIRNSSNDGVCLKFLKYMMLMGNVSCDLTKELNIYFEVFNGIVRSKNINLNNINVSDLDDSRYNNFELAFEFMNLNSNSTMTSPLEFTSVKNLHRIVDLTDEKEEDTPLWEGKKLATKHCQVKYLNKIKYII